MANRRAFLKHSVLLTATGLVSTQHLVTLADEPASKSKLAPPPDLFDSQSLDIDFWLKPRTLDLVRPASGERLQILYWRDGEVIDSAYDKVCHLLRDVNGKKSARIDPKLLETL